MEKETKTVNINIRVSEKVKKELSTLANKDKRSLSDFLRLHMEELAEKKGHKKD